MKKVNHIAIIVSDVGTSLAFYEDVLGFQTIRRPNFDRVGAWLTMGNIELHLIKGPPIVHQGDNLIVPHISLESDDIESVLKKLLQMGVHFSKNVSVPDPTEKFSVTQFFLKDPDGYYIELCNCSVLTEFCLNLNPSKFLAYQELVDQIEITNIFDLALLAEKVRSHVKSDGDDYILPEDQWAKEADAEKCERMFKRVTIYGDPMQGETKESIAEALRQANNHVPTATRIIRHKHHQTGQAFIPPAIFPDDAGRYQPTAISVASVNTTERQALIQSGAAKNSSYEDLVRKAFERFDINGDGSLDRAEIYRVLHALHQHPTHEVLDKIFQGKDSIGIEDFVVVMAKKKPSENVQLNAFFKLLDNDGNQRITVSEFFMAIRALGITMSDREIEEIFIEGDVDGDGVLDLHELELLLLSLNS